MPGYGGTEMGADGGAAQFFFDDADPPPAVDDEPPPLIYQNEEQNPGEEDAGEVPNPEEAVGGMQFFQPEILAQPPPLLAAQNPHGLLNAIQEAHADIGGLAHWNHWLMAHHQLHGNAGAGDLNLNLDIDLMAAIPNMHMIGILPEDIVTFFHSNGLQDSPQRISTMRMLKKRILLLRERKPHYWHRVAFGLYKRTLRGPAGGCDARILVRPTPNGDSNSSVIWVHKFILANNPVFRQMLGYRRPEDCLQDEGGVVTDLDVPSINAEGMRAVVKAAYDLPLHNLSLESALYLEYWAIRFCMDELVERCQKTIRLSPMR